MDDPTAENDRLRITKNLEEFVWTPGCRREQKLIPTFDFSEQLSVLPADAIAKLAQVYDDVALRH
jgi:hypothetical protein